MKTYKGKEVEVLVEPHGQSMSYYSIKYREKRRFNWFNYRDYKKFKNFFGNQSKFFVKTDPQNPKK